MNAKEKQNLIIKNIVKPMLKEKGYKNKGNNYSKEESEFFKIITLQNFSWNSKDDVEFCFNFGILIKNIINEDLVNVGVQHCQIQVRESAFLPQTRDTGKYRERRQYNIKSETDENEFGKLIEEDFELYILKDFDSIKTLDDCLDKFGNIPFWGERIKMIIYKRMEG
jgi:hypothetical protein